MNCDSLDSKFKDFLLHDKIGKYVKNLCGIHNSFFYLFFLKKNKKRKKKNKQKDVTAMPMIRQRLQQARLFGMVVEVPHTYIEAYHHTVANE